MATATLTVDSNLDTFFTLVPNSDTATVWTTGTWADIDEGLSPNDSDFIQSDTSHPNTHKSNLSTGTLGTNELVRRVATFGRVKQSGWADDAFSFNLALRNSGGAALASGVIVGPSTPAPMTSYTDVGFWDPNPVGSQYEKDDQTELNGYTLEIVTARSSVMSADSITAYCSNLYARVLASVVPKDWGLQNDVGSAVLDYTGFNSDDASYVITGTVDGSTPRFQGYGLSNTPADFDAASALTVNVRMHDTGRTGGATGMQMGFCIRSGHETGTVLAAANSGGTFQTQNTTGSETLYNIDFGYINTTATKAEWDAAVIIIKATTLTAGTASGLFDLLDFTLTYSTGGGVTANAQEATGTGTAYDATARLSAGPTAPTATGTGTAPNASPKVSPSASTATATGTAYPASPKISPAPSTATGTGTASPDAPKIAPVAQTATGTGTAYNPTVRIGQNVTAQTATGTGTAFDATARLSAGPTAQTATGSGTALDPSPKSSPVAPTASGTGTALNPSPKSSPTLSTAAATGTAFDATAQVSAGPTAQTATGTGTAFDCTVTITGPGGTTVNAQDASGTGTANTLSATIKPTTIDATATGTAFAPSPTDKPAPTTATASGTANSATVTQSPTAQTATGTGSALSPSPQSHPTFATATGTGSAPDTSPKISPTAVTATGTGTAYDCSVTITGPGVTTVTAQTATGTGTAYDASVLIRAAPFTATATGTAYDATASIPTAAATVYGYHGAPTMYDGTDDYWGRHRQRRHR